MNISYGTTWPQRTKELKFILLYSVRIFTLNIDFFPSWLYCYTFHCSHATNLEDFIIYVIPGSDASKCINEWHRIKTLSVDFRGEKKTILILLQDCWLVTDAAFLIELFFIHLKNIDLSKYFKSYRDRGYLNKILLFLFGGRVYTFKCSRLHGDVI